MKNLKKFMALVIAMVMVMAMGVTVFAADITVQNADVYYCVNNVSLAMVYEWKDFQGCDALINEKLFEIR